MPSQDRKGIRFIRTGIRERCESPGGCWELNLGPLEELPVLLTVEPPLQPHQVLSDNDCLNRSPPVHLWTISTTRSINMCYVCIPLTLFRSHKLDFLPFLPEVFQGLFIAFRSLVGQTHLVLCFSLTCRSFLLDFHKPYTLTLLWLFLPSSHLYPF